MEVLVQVEKANIKGLPEGLLNDKDYEINNIIEHPSLIKHKSTCCIM